MNTVEQLTAALSSQRYSWDESKHPRGQPDNAGEFAEKATSRQSATPDWKAELESAETHLRNWYAKNPRPDIPYGTAPVIPPGTPNRKQAQKAADEQHFGLLREWHRQQDAEQLRLNLPSLRKQKTIAMYRDREAENVSKYKHELDALTWAQGFAGRNTEAQVTANLIKSGIADGFDIHNAWFPGASAYVQKRLRKAGGKRSHTSGNSGAHGSVYYDMPDGRQIRLTDHELPQTAEREYNHTTFGKPKWREIILNQVVSPNAIDQLIDDALSTEDESEDDDSSKDLYSLTSVIQRELTDRRVVRYKGSKSAGFWSEFTKGFAEGMGGNGRFDEKLHPRGQKGNEKGGKFVSKGDSGGPALKSAANKPPKAQKPEKAAKEPETVDPDEQARRQFEQKQRAASVAKRRMAGHSKYITEALSKGPVKGNQLWKEMGIPKDDFLDAYFALADSGQVQQDQRTGVLSLTPKPPKAPRAKAGKPASAAKVSPITGQPIAPARPPQIAEDAWGKMDSEQQVAIAQALAGQNKAAPAVIRPNRTPEQEQARTEAKEKTRQQFEERMAQGQTEARKASREENTQRLTQTAEDYGISPDDLMDAAKFVLDEKRKTHIERERAKQYAREVAHLTAGDLSRMENNHQDYANLKGFDDAAQAFARQYPGVIGNADDPNADFARGMWDLIREGAQQPPSLYDQDNLNEAAQYVKVNTTRQPGEDDTGELVPASDLEEVPFAKPGSPERYSRYCQWRDVVRAFKIEYAKTETVQRYARMFAEHYAKQGQRAFVWTDEDEAKHPRDNDGQFAEKNEGDKKDITTETPETSNPIRPESQDKPLTSLSENARLPADEKPIPPEAKGETMDTEKRFAEIDEALNGFADKGGAGLEQWQAAAEKLRAQPEEYWEEHKAESTKKLLRSFTYTAAKPTATSKKPQEPINLAPVEEPKAKTATKSDHRRKELIDKLDLIGVQATETKSKSDKPLLVLRGDTKPIREIIKAHGGTFSPKKDGKDDPRWFIEGPRKMLACLEDLVGKDPDATKAIAEKQRSDDSVKESAKSKAKADREAAWAAERKARNDKWAAERKARNDKWAAEKAQKAKEASDEKDTRRKSGWTVSGNTYPIRDALRSAGGIWDADNNQWLMPSEEAANKFREKLGQKGKAEAVPDNAIQLEGGSGYGHHGYTPGQVIRNSPKKIEKGEPEYLYILSANSQYVREDGLSFGVGDESGYSYSATARPATDEESAPVKARIASTANRKASHETLKTIARDVQQKGEVPSGDNAPQGETIPIGKGQDIYGGGEWYVIGPEWIWYVENNGRDGDDWSYNNVRTGGAGAIGHRIPYDPAIADAIRNNAAAATEPAHV